MLSTTLNIEWIAFEKGSQDNIYYWISIRPCWKITHWIYQYRRNLTNQDFGKSLPLQTCIFDIISVEQICLKLICISLNLYNVVKDLFRQELCMVYSSGIFLY